MDHHGHHILECNQGKKQSPNFDFSFTLEDQPSSQKTQVSMSFFYAQTKTFIITISQIESTCHVFNKCQFSINIGEINFNKIYMHSNIIILGSFGSFLIKIF